MRGRACWSRKPSLVAGDSVKLAGIRDPDVEHPRGRDVRAPHELLEHVHRRSVFRMILSERFAESVHRNRRRQLQLRSHSAPLDRELAITSKGRKKSASAMANNFESELRPNTIHRWPAGVVHARAQWEISVESE